jgi:parallel beta-helix repeat protein
LYYDFKKNNYQYNPVSTPNAGSVFCMACQNIKIVDLNLTHQNSAGIFIPLGSNIEIENVLLKHNLYGLYSANNQEINFHDSVTSENMIAGIYLNGVFDDITIDSVESSFNSRYGLQMLNSIDLFMRDTSIKYNSLYNFYIDGKNIDYYYHDIDASNIINDNYPIYYDVNISDYTYDASTAPNAAGIFCINCDRIKVKGITLGLRNSHGILLYNNTQSVIQNVKVNNFNRFGINIVDGTENQLYDINSSFNRDGIRFVGSNKNHMQDVDAGNNFNVGFYLDQSDFNRIESVNSIQNTNYGLQITGSHNNSFDDSVFYKNNYGLYLYSSTNNPLLPLE